jgi:serine/threonine protein kinase/Tfp pilus assembly protein PilF
MTFEPGALVGHYRIVAMLGTGGMGVVYRAEDLRLGRQVALKFLPAGLSQDHQALDRLRREARTASALNHPHICTIHDVDEHQGQHFIAMELLEGQTLRQQLHGQPLPTAEILDVGLQLADALDAAHAKGVIHRDLKPANIFVTTRGAAKLLDFGLAKVAGARPAASDAPTAAAEWRTETGVTLGTVGYMSPEQVRGEVLDARSDLFSLGVVLYEMTTGIAPFRGATSGAVLGEILTKAPVAPVRLNPQAPPELERIVNKLLEKDREVRYQSARDLLVDLRRLKRDEESTRAVVSGLGSAPHAPSLAVLPFANLSADKENEYFSDGLAEDIIDALAQVSGLRVMARTSSFAFRGKEQDVRKIGAELNVEHILEGSVRRAGSRIRVTAQLVNASDGYHLWSQRYDREMTDVFAIQDEISRAIVEKLRLRLSAGGSLVKRYTENLAAYDLCLKARSHLLTMTQEGREVGRRYCEQAIALDPGYALAHAMLAESYFWSAFWGMMDPREAFAGAKSAAIEALRLDNTVADAHSALGTVLGCGEFDWRGAEREFDRARELNPSSTTVRYAYAWCYAMWFLLPLGRTEEALAEMRRALELDPLDPFYNALLGYLLHATGRFDLAVTQFQRAIDLDPTFNFSHMLFAMTSTVMERPDLAIATAEKAHELSGRSATTLWVLSNAYARAGRTAEAREILQELKARRQSSHVPASAFALVHLGLHEVDECLEWLARAVEERDPIIVTSLKTAQGYDPLRPHPAFQALLRKMNLEL